MRKLIAALALFAAPALAAIETTTITGTVYSPSGGAYPGKVTCTLSHAGTASDGTNQQVVASYYTATINSDGSLSMTLVPNDVITPSGTWYSCEYTVQPVGGRRMTWVKTYSVTTSPDPVALGAVAILDNPSLTLPTISGAANSMMATDGSGGLVATPSLQRVASGNAVKFAGRYYDWDTTGDGTMDARLCQDYDGDGSLEWADIQSCIDTLCDRDIDSTQDGTALDMDGDGTVGTHEKRCGTVYLGPGLWLSSASASDRINIKWKGLTLLGAGVNATIIKPSFNRATYCATLPTTRNGIIQTQDIDGVISGATAGSSKGADFLEIGNLTIDNIGARSATAAAGSVTGGPTDCNSDGTADSGSSGEGLNNLNVKGLPGDTNSDSTYDTWDTVDYVYLHDINMLNCDGACLFVDESNTGKFERLAARNSSEHCYAAHGNDQVWTDITGVNCGNKNWGGRGLEVFVGNVDTKRFSFSNFNLQGNIGIGIISANNSALTPSAPAKVGDGILIQNGHVAANDVKDTGSADTGYCIQSNTASNMAGKIKNVQFQNIALDSCSGYGVHMSQYDQNFTFTDMRVKNTSYDTGSTAYPAVQLLGTDMTFQTSDIELSDFAADGTYDTLGGFDLTSCTRCKILGNYIHGTGYPANSTVGVLVNSTSDQPLVSNNEMDLNRGSSITNYVIGIFPKNTDDGEYRSNTIRLPAVTNKVGVYLGSGGSADRNIFVANRVIGGSQGFYEESGAISSYTVGMFNYAAPSLAGGIGFNLPNTKDTSIWAYNICQSPDNSACFSFSASTATARNIGNIAMAPKTSTGGTRSLTASINSIEFASDLTNNNVVETGIYLAGSAVQNISFEGTTVDANRVEIVPEDPTAARSLTLPNTSGKFVISSGAAATGGFVAWATGTITCTNVCTAAASFKATACDFAYHVNTTAWTLTASTCGDATNETKQCVCR